MTPNNQWLAALTSEDLMQLQTETDELTDLQQILDRLPVDLQVETLSDAALVRLREVASEPEALLTGPNLFLWNNVSRRHKGRIRLT